LLKPLLRSRVKPAQVPARKHLTWLFDDILECVLNSVLGVGVEVVRRIEVGQRDVGKVIEGVGLFLTWVADIHKKLNSPLLSVKRGIPGNQPIAGRIDEHLEDLMAGDQLPIVLELDGSKRLFFVEMKALNW